jgi:glycosyltransferase involved in cell wall biosynthesis
MIIIVYSATREDTIRDSLGAPEYSYYFVLKEYLPILEQLGKVMVVADPSTEVDPIYDAAQLRGEYCVFLSFSPPDKTEYQLRCPTVPVFAWEFYNLPDEAWDGKPENDWRFVLGKLGWAITHSSFSVDAVRNDIRRDYPVIAIPAPVYDRFAKLGEQDSRDLSTVFDLEVDGIVFDSRAMDLEALSPENPQRPILAFEHSHHTLSLDGVVYTAILNPIDNRKNWPDVLWTFGWAFRDIEDVTLVIKLTHTHAPDALSSMVYDMYKMSPMKCRIILIEGYLPDDHYERLALNSTYAVNASKGEGQCLPLMEYMSCGKPAIAPRHSGIRDYINEDTAFVIESSLEPSYWPHDPRVTLRTLCCRISFESMVKALNDSYHLVKNSPDEYRKMGNAAKEMMSRHCSMAVTKRALELFFRTHEGMQEPFNTTASTAHGSITTVESNQETPVRDTKPLWRRLW